MIEIDSVVSEIWPGKFKSRGARLFRQVRLFGKIRYNMTLAFCRYLKYVLSRKDFALEQNYLTDFIVRGW